MAAFFEQMKFTLDFPITPVGTVSVLNVDLVPMFGADYIKPPSAAIPCYPAGTPNTFSLEARVVEADVLRVGLRNNSAMSINPGPIDVWFIFLNPAI